MKTLVRNLGWIGLAVLLVGLTLYSLEDYWTLWAKILAIGGAAILTLGVVLNFKEVRATLKSRTALLGVQSLFSVVVFVGILGLVNFMGQRHPKRWDLTSQGTFSLSDQTLQVLESLQKDVQIKAFFEDGEYVPLKDLLTEYRSHSTHIAFQFVDPNRNPQVAAQYDVTTYGTFMNPFTGTAAKYGTIILEAANRIEKVEKNQEPVLEEDLTNALIKVTREESKTAYFLDGHGEKSFDNQENEGLSAFKTQLERENFVVKTLNLVRESEVPQDCALLIVAGPETEPFPQELDQVTQYLERGGSVLMLLDPQPAAGLGGFLSGWGVEVGNNVVVDASGMGRLLGAGPEIPLVTEYGTHRITEKFGNLMTFFPLVRSVAPVESPPAGITVDKLLETNRRSWAETGALEGQIAFDEGQDTQGPISLGVAVEKDLPGAVSPEGQETRASQKSRMVVVGDSDFGSNAYFSSQGNGNLLMNMANWLAADEDLISIRPKDPQDRRVVLSARQQKLIFYLSVVTLPLLVIIGGVTVWLQRKKL